MEEQKPTRFFINTDALPSNVAGKLVSMGKQLLSRFKLMQEAGVYGNVWNVRTNEGIIFKLDKSGDIDNVRIYFPPPEVEEGKVKTYSTEMPIMVIVIDYGTSKPMIILFYNLEKIGESFKLPDSGVDNVDTFKNVGYDSRSTEIKLLKPIHSMIWNMTTLYEPRPNDLLKDGATTWLAFNNTPKVIIGSNVPEIAAHTFDYYLGETEVLVSGSVIFHIGAGVVVGAKGYTDFETWGVIYGVATGPGDWETQSGYLVVKFACYDKKNGFREYIIWEGAYPVDALGDQWHHEPEAFGYVDIFDFNGIPYFVGALGWIFGGGDEVHPGWFVHPSVFYFDEFNKKFHKSKDFNADWNGYPVWFQRDGNRVDTAHNIWATDFFGHRAEIFQLGAVSLKNITTIGVQ